MKSRTYEMHMSVSYCKLGAAIQLQDESTKCQLSTSLTTVHDGENVTVLCLFVNCYQEM